MVKLKRSLGGLVADPDHKLAAHDAGEHVPSQEEGKAAEHLAFGHFGVGGHDLADAVGEVLVVGHQASKRPGRSKKRPVQGSRRAVIPADHNRLLSQTHPLTRVHTTPLGDMPGPALAGFTTLDILVHGWDLAQATGRSAALDDTLAAHVLAFAEQAITPGFRTPRIGPAVPVAADAPLTATQVEFSLTPTPAGTHLRLVHSGLPPSQAPMHATGWNHFLPRLSLAAGTDPGPGPWNQAS